MSNTFDAAMSSYAGSLHGSLCELGVKLQGYAAVFLQPDVHQEGTLTISTQSTQERTTKCSENSLVIRTGDKNHKKGSVDVRDISTTDVGASSDVEGYTTEEDPQTPNRVSPPEPRSILTSDGLSLVFHDFVQFDFRAESREMNLAHAVVTFRFCQRIKTTQSVPHCVLMMCAIRLLVVRGFPFEDIVSTLGLALANLEHLQDTTERMGVQERTMVSICQLYLVHSFLEDEYLPLVAWHRHLFSSYCSFGTLHHAVMKLWKLRGFRLLVPRETCLTKSRELLEPMEVLGIRE